MKVLIIGGGIAGPALALLLKRAGHDVEIFDRVVPPAAIAPGSPWLPADIGGAILLNENILRAFKHLGVLDQILAAGTQVRYNQLGRFDGRLFAQWDTFDGKEFPTTGALRSAITRIICKAMNEEGIFVKVNKKLVAIDQPADGGLGVVAQFEDGTTARGDILVGADGINSSTRALLFPDVKLKRSNYSGYFAISSLDGAPSPVDFKVLMDGQTGNSAFIIPAGDKMVYWGLYESRPNVNESLSNSWDSNGDLATERANMLSLIDRWRLPQEFRGFADRTARVININFCAVPPLPQWHRQNCVLIGDAAHGMYPFLGQGAGMSLEDVVSLAMLLGRASPQAQPVAKAFEMLHEVRAPRADKVSALSEAMGARVGSSPAGAALAYFILRLMSYASRVTRASFFNDEIVRYDCTEATDKFIQAKGL
ncbi:hypothetical protein HK405_009314 [Cladochytrium tenue]|nr:hypothetical protein HK405_009314 [Cladochytrium tenue]